ncbi:hypothetical protein BDN67DRAFT_985779 [Paxillus ammoniavirescens]|nr:hypothetical protein BDN67DRAFT_985779 [Paxillus ammoniavirescens]
MSLLAHFQLNQGLALSTLSNGRPETEAQAGGSQSEATTDGTRQVPARATSLSPPPESPCAQRRPRSPSADADLEDPVCVLKRQKQYAAGLCSKFNLPDDSLQDFAGQRVTDVSWVQQDLATMLIHVQATLLKFESSREKENALLFIKSDEFKAFAKKNLPVFKIPAKALEDPKMTEKIDTLIKDVLTKQRAQIKSKIIAGIKAKSHISVLVRILSPSGVYEITTHHWAHTSFLRACLISFNELISKSMAAKVADQQKNKDPEGVPTNAVQQVSHTEESADPDAEDSEGDMKQFPGSKRNAPIPASTSVTVQWQKAIHEELVW